MRITDMISANQQIKEKKYWENLITGDFEKTTLPYTYMPNNNYKEDMVSDFLEPELYEKMNKISNADHINNFMILTACLNILLNLYTGQKKISVGTTIFEQSADKNYVNTIFPIYNELDLKSTFKDHLLKTRSVVFQAVQNQNYPMSALIYNLKLDSRDNIDYPLFDVAIIHGNIQNANFLRDIKANLIFCFKEIGGRLEFTITYNTCLYSRNMIQRVNGNFKQIVLSCLENHSINLGELNFISKEEMPLLYGMNQATKAQHSLECSTIHELFEEQVDKTPDHIAITFEGRALTYRELNAAANKLARMLMAQKNKSSGQVIGLMLERSLEMIIGMLAILKAGFAYLPIDVDYPLERKEFMLKDSGAAIILSDKLIDYLKNYSGCIIDICKTEKYQHYSTENIGQEQNHARLAYIIYTSGSTGMPKGVMVNHASILNTLRWRNKFYAFDENDSVLQIPSFSFDSSVEDIFCTLLSGSKLVLINNESRFDISYLKDVISNENITHFLMTPALYHNLLDEYADYLRNLRIITIAGENFTEELVKKHFSKLAQVRIVNEYGPCENSVCSSFYEFTKDNIKVLIGKAIANVNLYIVDQYLRLCPIGAAGELCVAGDGITMGYLNNEELTNEKFIDDPFAKKGKMYKTGDIVKMHDDANIEFIGREDHQIKIRGFRIELGEIENHLLQMPHVKETTVLALDGPEMNKFLVQFYVSDHKLSSADLKNFLKLSLPVYMVPTYMIQVEQIPITINGKIDRTKLIGVFNAAEKEVEFKSPTSATEIKLAEIWKDVLALEKISVTTNFFDAGGHSLTATKMVAAINRIFSINMPLKEIFQHQTISELGALIDSAE